MYILHPLVKAIHWNSTPSNVYPFPRTSRIYLNNFSTCLRDWSSTHTPLWLSPPTSSNTKSPNTSTQIWPEYEMSNCCHLVDLARHQIGNKNRLILETVLIHTWSMEVGWLLVTRIDWRAFSHAHWLLQVTRVVELAVIDFAARTNACCRVLSIKWNNQLKSN